VENGWLTRRPGHNRRTYRLALTEAGVQAWQQVAPRAVALAEHTLSEISLDQLQQMRAGLEIIEARLRDYTPPQAGTQIGSE